MASSQAASNIQLLGAGGFGIIIGWFVYYINRHRKEDIKLSDLAAVIGVIGGGAVLALFPARTDLFGAYGIGLFIGFFAYFLILVVLVSISKEFGVNFFIDGRRKKLDEETEVLPDGARGAMGDRKKSKVINE